MSLGLGVLFGRWRFGGVRFARRRCRGALSGRRRFGRVLFGRRGCRGVLFGQRRFGCVQFERRDRSVLFGRRRFGRVQFARQRLRRGLRRRGGRDAGNEFSCCSTGGSAERAEQREQRQQHQADRWQRSTRGQRRFDGHPAASWRSAGGFMRSRSGPPPSWAGWRSTETLAANHSDSSALLRASLSAARRNTPTIASATRSQPTEIEMMSRGPVMEG
jgi:hypothetical protein